MDEPWEVLGRKHRMYRHDPKTTPQEAKQLFGEFADHACLDHILLDYPGLMINKQMKIGMDVKFCEHWQGDENSKFCRLCVEVNEGSSCYDLWQAVRELAEQRLVFENNRPGKAFGNRYRIESPKENICYLQMLQGKRTRFALPIEDFLYVTITGRGGMNETPSKVRQNPFVDLLLKIIAENTIIPNGTGLIEAVRNSYERVRREIGYDENLLRGDMPGHYQHEAPLRGKPKDLSSNEPRPDQNILSWTSALEEYSYPVNLIEYRHIKNFPGYFVKRIEGNRVSTIEFENYFRKNALERIQVYYEVIFWKLYSRIVKHNELASNIMDSMVNRMQQLEVDPAELFYRIETFAKEPTLRNFQDFRALLGLKKENGTLAIASTFPAFVDPVNFPIMDVNVANWVNSNLSEHNLNRKVNLSKFEFSAGSLQDNNFPSYINWAHWCRETASLLTKKTHDEWRARDVEMAVFAASKNSLALEVL